MKHNLTEAVELYKSGMTMEEVAAKTGIPYNAIRPELKKLGIIRSNKENLKRHTPEMLTHAIELFRAGWCINDVNIKSKVSKYTLRRVLNDPDLIQENKVNSIELHASDNLKQAAELYKQGHPILDLEKSTGIKRGVLQHYFKKIGITRSNKINSRKYTLQHDFFYIIDNEDKAYWLGFMCADGYITTGNKVGIALKDTDEPHLEKFRQIIKSTYPIGHYVNKSFGVEIDYVRLLMTSDQMFNDLQAQGVVLRKSLILTFPTTNQVPQHLIHHFIRGYFDGDGSFSKSNDGGYAVKICGTKEFLNALSEHIGFPNRNLSKRYKDDKNNYCLEIGGRQQVLQIGRYMYKDATICLERKHNRYQELNY